jgi:hypothetical protein
MHIVGLLGVQKVRTKDNSLYMVVRFETSNSLVFGSGNPKYKSFMSSGCLREMFDISCCEPFF